MAEPQGMDDLVRRYQRRVFAVIYRMTGRHAEVDDLCQETFLQVFRSLPRFRAGTDLDAWVYRIATNVSVDYLRRKGKERDLAGRADEPRSGGPRESEAESAVRRAIGRLPADQRTVLVLRMFEGLSHERIAEIVETPVATVRWRFFAARRRLDELLGPLVREE